MLRKLFFFSCILATVRGWALEVSHTAVAKHLTPNVTLRCLYDGRDNGFPTFLEISRIRIMKYVTDNNWISIAKISSLHQTLNTPLTASVEGHADKLSNSYIFITFPLASAESIGHFRCDIDGYSITDSVQEVKTRAEDITERGISYDDVHDILLKFKNDENADHLHNLLRIGLAEKPIGLLENKDRSRSKSLNDMVTQLTGLRKNFLKVSNALVKAQGQIAMDIESIKEANKNRAWPEGVYTILNTLNGCPHSVSFDWASTTVRITTQRGPLNTDKTSASLHMKTPVLGNNTSTQDHTVNMESCSKAVATSGPAWPRGSYCIQSYSKTAGTVCPVNFNYGTLTFDRYNVGADYIVNLPNYLTNIDITTLGYCCRADGAINHPILLPANDPFYLYSYGGGCQEVAGMNVTNESISFHTLTTKDAYLNSFHPDGKIKPVRLELCYYEPML